MLHAFLRPNRLTPLFVIALVGLLSACATPVPPAVGTAAKVGGATVNAAKAAKDCECKEEPAKPAAPPMQPARWSDLTGWDEDNLSAPFAALLDSCTQLQRQLIWRNACQAARSVDVNDDAAIKSWALANLQPWQLVNPDGNADGLVTGYYEPMLRGSRSRSNAYATPVFGTPDDLIVVDLSSLYPELKHMRLRGRLEGRRLVPYYSRAEWEAQQAKNRQPILWVADPLDFFFMQIQGSGLVTLDDGSRTRLNYADQNGQPYRSIGRWLIDQGELTADQASMQNIKAWARTHPNRLQELMNANPSMVFFREVSADAIGPQGAMGLPLTPERSIAVDPRYIPLGTPIWLATTYPNSDRPLRRLMLAQDTGGAIRGVVRADFYWGSGDDAGTNAGKMKQSGKMWALMPLGYVPPVK